MCQVPGWPTGSGDVVRMRIAETEMEAAAMREYIATG